jgi:hypothetical protein
MTPSGLRQSADPSMPRSSPAESFLESLVVLSLTRVLLGFGNNQAGALVDRLVVPFGAGSVADIVRAKSVRRQARP